MTRVTRYIGYDRPQQYDERIETPDWVDDRCKANPQLVIPLVPFVLAYHAQAHIRKALVPRIPVYLEVRGSKWTLLVPPARLRNERQYERLNLGVRGVSLSNTKRPMRIVAAGEVFRLPETLRRFQVFEDGGDLDSNQGVYRTPSKRPGDLEVFELPKRRPRGGPKACLTYAGTSLQLACDSEIHTLEILPHLPEAFLERWDGLTLEAWLERQFDTAVAMNEQDGIVRAQLTVEGIPIEVQPTSMESYMLEVRTPVDEQRSLKMSPQGPIKAALTKHGYGVRTGDDLFDQTWWIKGDLVSLRALAEYPRLRDAAPWGIRGGWASAPVLVSQRSELRNKITAMAYLSQVLSVGRR